MAKKKRKLGKKNRNLEITKIAKTIVRGEHRTFSNPKYRGAKFTWKRWASQAPSWVTVHLFAYLTSPPTKKEKKLAALVARKEAKRLIAKKSKKSVKRKRKN